ncbi:hypothetical protein DBR06_SOUSAS39410004, partial [Sousa chinensis]
LHMAFSFSFEIVKVDHGLMLYRTHLSHTLTGSTYLWVLNNGINDGAYVIPNRVFQGFLK